MGLAFSIAVGILLAIFFLNLAPIIIELILFIPTLILDFIIEKWKIITKPNWMRTESEKQTIRTAIIYTTMLSIIIAKKNPYSLWGIISLLGIIWGFVYSVVAFIKMKNSLFKKFCYLLITVLLLLPSFLIIYQSIYFNH